MKKAILILLPAFLWTLVGSMLISKGIRLLSQAGTLYLLFLGIPVGLLKGHFVLRKRALALLEAISTQNKIPKGFFLIIPLMILLGFLLRFVPLSLRGVIDVAVGVALMVGSLYCYVMYGNRYRYHRN